jgi:gamma-glutamyl:cysteine ligase YbdK (ATP-grasp superfamily)
MVEHLISSVTPDAEALGCAPELACLKDLTEGDIGARRQLQVVDDGFDRRALVAELIERSRPG